MTTNIYCSISFKRVQIILHQLAKLMTHQSEIRVHS